MPPENDPENSPETSWTLEIDADEVAWLTFDRPGASANSLSRAAILELERRLTEIEGRRPRALVILSGKNSGFIAGADVKEFTELASHEAALELVHAGQRAFARLERLPCETIAALHGFVLGGGLELALACRHRIAAADSKLVLGLPEVQLGIHPAWGGTVRTVRLLGPLTALDLLVSGRTVRSAEALRIGLVDRLAPLAELRAQAKALALNPPTAHRPTLKNRLLNGAWLRPFIASKVAERAARRVRRDHYPAPFAVIDLWRRYGANPARGYEAEAQSMSRLLMGETARNLVRVFLLQDRMKSLGNRSRFKAQHVHVVGAGVMGGDIAAWCAVRGLQVTLQDRTAELVAAALQRSEKVFARRGHDGAERDQAAARLTADVAGNGAARADVVIEAIYENAAAKQALYAAVEPQLQPTALLTSNTSSIVLEELSTGLADPSRFVGLHFFNPVPRMALVEIVQGRQTRPEVVEAAMAFARQLDKLPLPCRSSPGFVVNRILMPYLTEAMLAAEEGVPYTVIDRVAIDFGMPVGPLELADVVGLDIAAHVGGILAQAYGKPAPKSVQRLVDEKNLGKKSGRGFYEWRDGKAVKPPLQEGALRSAPADLQDRLILPMLNESVAVLRAAVVEDADLLDGGVIFGTGFAPFRGGPLQYARSRGVAELTARLEALAAAHGAHLRPDLGWRDFV